MAVRAIRLMAKYPQNEVLDITGDVCPMTFVRVKLRLEKMPPGGVLAVRLRAGEALANVPRSLRQEGHEILAQDNRGQDIYQLLVRKSAV